jgi:protein ImuB
MAPPNESLFPEPGGSEEDRMRMLELLVARLGADNVLQALPQADYRPEQAKYLGAGAAEGARAVRCAQMPPDVHSLPRPTWLLAKPIALLMRNHRPFYGSPLKMASTPERIEAGWWSQTADARLFHRRGAGPYAVLGVPRADRGVGGCGAALVLHGLFG